MLIQQVAKREILAILINEEKKEVEDVETMLKAQLMFLWLN